jgi:hypothetical protein
MVRLLTFALLAATASVPLSSAQMRGGRSFSAGRPHTMHRSARGAFLGSPFFYPDYETQEPYPTEEAPPPVIRTQRPNSMDDSPRTPKPAPLLIEWRGDRYVRFGGAQATGGSGNSANPDYAESQTTSSAGQKAITAARSEASPSAVLVYHDGHREEISGYAIANGMIYAQNANWQSGRSTQPVPLSALDPLATVAANQQRGVTFLLPTASNVVIASF